LQRQELQENGQLDSQNDLYTKWEIVNHFPSSIVLSSFMLASAIYGFSMQIPRLSYLTITH
jgi:hypothetical protein